MASRKHQRNLNAISVHFVLKAVTKLAMEQTPSRTIAVFGLLAGRTVSGTDGHGAGRCAGPMRRCPVQDTFKAIQRGICLSRRGSAGACSTSAPQQLPQPERGGSRVQGAEAPRTPRTPQLAQPPRAPGPPPETVTLHKRFKAATDGPIFPPPPRASAPLLGQNNMVLVKMCAPSPPKCVVINTHPSAGGQWWEAAVPGGEERGGGCLCVCICVSVCLGVCV